MENFTIKLSDSEWMEILDGVEGHGLPNCCANISALRDVFISHVRQGRNQTIRGWELTELKQKIKWVFDGHDLPLLIKKVCEQIGYDPSKDEHTKDAES